MLEANSGQFDQLGESMDRWRKLPRPMGTRRSPDEETYQIDLDLDHVASYLSSLGDRALKRDTRIDWGSVAPTYLEEIDKIESSLNVSGISAAEKKRYGEYLTECRLIWEKMRSLPVPPEGHMGFRKVVLDEFRFLNEEYQFRIARSSPIDVRYESSALFVELAFSPECPEISFVLGRIAKSGESEKAFYLDDVTYMAGLGSFDFGQVDLNTESGIRSLVQSAAKLVRENLGDVLRNDQNALKLLMDMAAERDKRYAEEMGRHRGREPIDSE